MSVAAAGALALGTVLGYVTHYLLRRDQAPGAHDLAGIVASLTSGLVLDALGGPDRTGSYFLGLAFGFLLYWLALRLGQIEASAEGDSRRSARLGRLLPFVKRSLRRS